MVSAIKQIENQSPGPGSDLEGSVNFGQLPSVWLFFVVEGLHGGVDNVKKFTVHHVVNPEKDCTFSLFYVGAPRGHSRM